MLYALAAAAAVGCARVSSLPTSGGNADKGDGTDGGSGAAVLLDGSAFEPRGSTRADAALIAGGDGGTACQRELAAVIRDFRSGEKDGQPKHPDFEYMVDIDPGIVAPLLGGDGKPVYAGGTKGTTSTKENFDQWYRDVAGVNIHFDKTIPLSPDPTRPGYFIYDDEAFFPLGNDEGWGNQYLAHNYDFTTEIHVTFPYNGGELFTFRGDDDVFIFVAGQLVSDLGGVHNALTGKVVMDDWASKLGLVVGQNYRMDIFHAERHCCDSHFHLETTLACITNIVIQ